MRVTILSEKWIGTNLLVALFCWDCGKAFHKHKNWVEYGFQSGELTKKEE